MTDYDIMVADLRSRGPEDPLPTARDICEQWHLPSSLCQAIEQMQVASDAARSEAERRFALKRAWGHVNRIRTDLRRDPCSVRTIAAPGRKSINPRTAGDILGLRPELVLVLERIRFAVLSGGPSAVAMNLDDALRVLSDEINRTEKRKGV